MIVLNRNHAPGKTKHSRKSYLVKPNKIRRENDGRHKNSTQSAEGQRPIGIDHNELDQAIQPSHCPPVGAPPHRDICSASYEIVPDFSLPPGARDN